MKIRRLMVIGLALALLTALATVGFTANNSSGGGAKVVVEQTTQESKFEVKIWTDKPTYVVGESLTVFVKSEKAGYLTIYDFTSDKKVKAIYPNKYHLDNQIKANVVYQIPAPDDPFNFRIAPPLGEEMFVAIVTKKPGVAPLPESIREELFPEVSRDPDKFAGQMRVVVEGSGAEWGMGYTVFNVGTSPSPHPELVEAGWTYQAYKEQTSAGITIAWPIGFNPDSASQIGSWYWLSDTAFKNWSAWKFSVTPKLIAAHEVWLDFGLLVTNILQGGQGYETTVKVTLEVLNVGGSLIQEQPSQVQLQNPVRPKDPTYSYGIGWQTYGLLQIPASLIQMLSVGGKLLVKVERDPAILDAGYQPVVGASMDALVLRYR